MSKIKDKKKVYDKIEMLRVMIECNIRPYPMTLPRRRSAVVYTQADLKTKCYISGAIAHHDLKERMDTFERAAAVLEKAGYNPVNPFKNGVPQSEHWTKHMRRDIGLLVQCDYIYMLKGWELSKGAKLELDVASSCGIKVLFEK